MDLILRRLWVPPEGWGLPVSVGAKGGLMGLPCCCFPNESPQPSSFLWESASPHPAALGAAQFTGWGHSTVANTPGKPEPEGAGDAGSPEEPAGHVGLCGWAFCGLWSPGGYTGKVRNLWHFFPLWGSAGGGKGDGVLWKVSQNDS